MVCPFSHKGCIFCGLYRGRHYHLPFCESYRRRHEVSSTRSLAMEEQRRDEISKLPKLKVESPIMGYPKEIYDLEQAKCNLPFDYGISVVVDGQWISSYEELVQLVTHVRYKHKEFLEVKVAPRIVSGG